jgi:phage repressor protein C with HTH and peptisase S24 domain
MGGDISRTLMPSASPERMDFVSRALNHERMSTIADIRHANLLLLIKEAGGVQRLADRMGKAQAQISQYKTRSPLPSGKQRSIGDDFAREAEISFDKPRGWMDSVNGTGAGKMGFSANAVGEHQAPYQAHEEAEGEYVEVPVLGTVDRGADAEVEVPFYTSIAAAAGHGAHNGDGAPQAVKLRFRALSLRRKGIDPAHARVIYVKGDSMEPLMSDGDQIMFDASRTAIRDGELYVIRVDRDEMVKRLHKRPGDRVVVQSENPAFAPYEVGLRDPGFAVLGQVVWRAGWM